MMNSMSGGYAEKTGWVMAFYIAVETGKFTKETLDPLSMGGS